MSLENFNLKNVTLVYLGLGSNLEPEKHLPIAYQSLAKFGEIQQGSKVYQSAAIGIEGADFYNAALCLKTNLSLLELYQSIKQLEQQWLIPLNGQAERAFDIDILLFGDQVHKDKPLVPRDDIFKFPFVIQPLYELCPDLIIPNENGKEGCSKVNSSIEDIWQSFGTSLASLSLVDLNLTDLNLANKI